METETTQSPNVCRVCGKPEYEEGYASKMCADCRTRLSRLSIPLWVKVFATAILIFTLIDMIRAPRFFLTSIHEQRGENAENIGKYVTAEKEFKYVANVFPNSVENNARLIICCAHNLDYKGTMEAQNKVAGKESDDEQLITLANFCIDKLDGYLPGQKLDSFMVSIDTISRALYINSLTSYVVKNSNDFVAKYYLANSLYKVNSLKACDSILTIVLNNDKENIEALCLMAVAKREQGQYDSAIYFYNKVLEWNPEMLVAIAGKGRTEFKRHNDSQGIRLAKQAFDIDSTDSSALDAMALVYYFNNQNKEAIRMLDNAKSFDPNDSVDVEYIKDVINGRIKFR